MRAATEHRAATVLRWASLRRSGLGSLARPRHAALFAYACIVGELPLIAASARLLDSLGRVELRAPLIAAVVGLHFLPFAWAFAEAIFVTLDGLVAALEVTGPAPGVAAPSGPSWFSYKSWARSGSLP